MKKMRSILSIFLAVVLVVGIIPTAQILQDVLPVTAYGSSAPAEDTIYTYMARIALNYNYSGAATMDNTTLPNMRYNRYLDSSISSVARSTTEELNHNTAFLTGVTAWKTATFEPTDLLSAQKKEIGYYQAIIINIIGAAVEFSIIPSSAEFYLKNVNKLASGITKAGYEECISDPILNYNVEDDLLNSFEMTQNLDWTERQEIYEKLAEASDFKLYASYYDAINEGLEALSTVADVVKKVATDISIANLSDDIKALIDELYSNCPSSQYMMKMALTEIQTAMNLSLEGILMNAFAHTATELADKLIKELLKEMWKEVVKATLGSLAAGVFIGQVIGKTVANMLFSTNQIVEQWFKLSALVCFEDLMYDTIRILARRFKNAQTDQNARLFFTALQLLGNTYAEDYKMSEDLVEYVHEKGLINAIANGISKLFHWGGNSQVQQYHDDINHLKNSLQDLYDIATPAFYAKWHAIDMASNSSSSNSFNGKVVSVHCPTDIAITGSNGETLVKIVDDSIQFLTPGIYVNIDNSEKEIVLSQYDNYTVSISATDSGSMNYSISEIRENVIARQVSYANVPLDEDRQFESSLNMDANENSADYDLKRDDGEVIRATFDTLPPVETNVVDVIVAEELFEGFSTELIDSVADAMFNMRSSLDISSFLLTADNVMGLFSAVQKYYPSEYSILSKTDFTYKAIVSPSRGIVTGFRFYYDADVSLSVYQKRVRDLQQEIDKLVAQTEGMNDFEKALFVHDYLVLNCEYDFELLDMINSGQLDGEIRSERYTEYSVLVNGTGVCGSYALAYRAVLNAAGVECLYLSSAEMNHAWNLVKVNGNWYHVDCCWDDPVPDTYGQAGRTYFLCTDKEIMRLNHRSWTPGQYKATSERFVNMPRYKDCQQKYDAGYWFMNTGGSVWQCGVEGNNKVKVYSCSATAIDVENNAVYYTIGRFIYKKGLITEDSQLAYYLPASKAGDDINRVSFKNIYVNGDQITLYYTMIHNGKTETVKEVVTEQTDQYAAVTGLAIDAATANLEVFDSLQLNAVLLTSTGSVDDLTLYGNVGWLSSNETVVTVENGLVKAQNSGQATITAECIGFTASCEITVTADSLLGGCGDSATWSFDVNTKVLTIAGTGAMANYQDKYTAGIGYTTNSPWSAFQSEIVRVVIENGITSIGNSAFRACSSLESVQLSEQLQTINKSAFQYCSSLQSVILPDSVTSLGTNAFDCCRQLEAIRIGANLTTINDTSFRYCNAVRSVSVNSQNNNFFADESALYNKSKTRLILFVDKTATSYQIENGVVSIAPYAFYGCSLNMVDISHTVTTIEDYAFYEVPILSLFIPNSVTTIGSHSFYSKATQEIEIEDGAQEIGLHVSSNAFPIDNVQKLTIPAQFKAMDDTFFGHCNELKTVIITKGNKTMYSNYSSSDTSRPIWCSAPIESFILEDGITSISPYCLTGNQSLTAITIPESVSEIGRNAFYQSKLQRIVIPKNVSAIGVYAFSQAELTEIEVDADNNTYESQDGVLFTKDMNELVAYPVGKTDTAYMVPSVVQEISAGAFASSKWLERVTLSQNLQTIGSNAFTLCLNLKEIIVPEENEYFASSDGVLFTKDMSELLLYPSAKGAVYHMPDEVRKLQNYAFANATLSSLYLSSNLTSIGEHVFSECNNLRTVQVPDTVTSMSFNAFDNCNSLETLIISLNVNHSAQPFTNAPLSLNETVRFMHDCKVLFKNASFSFSYYVYKLKFEGTPIIYGHEDSTAQEYANSKDLSFVNIDAQPHEHDYLLMDYQPATEDADGFEYWECYCGESNYTNILHNYTDVEIAPTCTEDGLSKKVCTACGEEKDVEETPALGHVWQETARVGGNCVTPETIYYICSRCTATKEMPGEIGSGHAYEKTVIPATCADYGYTKAVCKDCGETIVYDFTSPLGHKLSLTETTEDCTAHGSNVYTCARCDYREEIAIGADELETRTETTPATCTAPGVEKELCVLCGATVSTTTLRATGHSFSEEYTVDVPATCTAEGSQSRHCTKCDVRIMTESIDPLGHDYGEWQIKTPATCTGAGVKERVCKNDANHTITETIDPLGHAYGDWHVKTAPTCTEPGVEERVCANDVSHKETRTIATVAHQDADGDGQCDMCDKIMDSNESPAAQNVCKYCGQVHPNNFIGRFIQFFHNVAYFFAHLFGKM